MNIQKMKTAFILPAIMLMSIGIAAAQSQPVAFTKVSVIDVADGVVQPDMTVVVTGDLITAVGPVDEIEVPDGATILDATGKYLIPGLWDMHAHTSSDRITREILYPLFVAHGVTGIRNMKADCFEASASPCDELESDIEQVKERRREVAAGELIGPRVVAGSMMVHGPPPREPSTVQDPGTEAHARALVRLLKERGVDFIKVYDMVPREAYFALADEAKALEIPFAGHVPFAVRASEASAAGQRSMEHVTGLIEECTAREDELRPQLLAELMSETPELLPTLLLMVKSFDEEKCDALYARFVENGTWHVPTLMIHTLPDRGAHRLRWREDPRIRYVPAEERVLWSDMQAEEEAVFGSGEAILPFSHKLHDITGAMHRAGVRLLAGSDAGHWGIFWGSGLHDELALLVGVGMTEAEALRAATLGPAEYFETTDSLGTVEAGKLGDLVLLDANPLEDIANTQRINAVVANGHYFDRQTLDRLLSEAEKAANPQEGNKPKHK